MSEDGTAAAETPGREAGTETDPSLSLSGVLGEALQRVRRTPVAALAMLLAGALVAGADWYRRVDAVPTTTYEGIRQGRYAVAFEPLLDVTTRTGVPASAFVDLKVPWLVTTVGVELATLVGVSLACCYALSRLLGVGLTVPVVLRYALLLAVTRYLVVSVEVSGVAAVLLVPVLVLAFVVFVRLFTLPGRLVLGDPVRPAVLRSLRATRGHAWSLLGLVVILGAANHLLVSVPRVGAVGSAAVGALHAGAVVAVHRRLGGPERTDETVPSLRDQGR